MSSLRFYDSPSVYTIMRDLPKQSRYIDLDSRPEIGEIIRLIETGETIRVVGFAQIGTIRVQRGIGSIKASDTHAGTQALRVATAVQESWSHNENYCDECGNLLEYPEMPWYAD